MTTMIPSGDIVYASLYFTHPDAPVSGWAQCVVFRRKKLIYALHIPTLSIVCYRITHADVSEIRQIPDTSWSDIISNVRSKFDSFKKLNMSFPEATIIHVLSLARAKRRALGQRVRLRQ